MVSFLSIIPANKKGEIETYMTKNVLLDCFVQNLEKERLNLGMTQAEFASKLEISVSTYKNIISRRTDKIDIMIAMQIYKLTGHFLYELFGNDNPEMECLKKFRLLNNRQKAYISGKIDFELEMMSHEQDSENMLDVLVLTGNMEDGMVLDSANEERIYCPEYIKKYGERLHCGIRITSNHLNPVYVRNDILGISKKPPRDGDTCILIHKPTGIVVSCQTQRDQFQNRETCMRMLRSKLIEIKEREHLDKISDIKGAQLKIEWGSQIRNYVFMPYTLVKDTRTGFETSNVNAVMDGALDGFINAYLTCLATNTWVTKS